MNRIIEIVLACVLVGTVLDFGGVQPLAYSLMEIALFAALLAVAIHQTWHGHLGLRVSVWPVLFALWTGIQLVPLPASLVRALQPARFQGSLGGQTGTGWLTLSVYPHATLLLGVRFLAYLAAFILAVYLFDSGRRGSLLVRTLVGIGLFEAAYGSVEYLTGREKIFTYTKQYYTGMATGTYINHNHFAGLLELTLPFLIGLVFYYFQMWQDSRRKRYSQPSTGASAGFQALVYLFLVIVILAGVIFSRSRGGILGVIFSLLLVAFLAQFRVRRKAWLLGLIAFLLIAGGYAFWIGVDPVLQRFEILSQGSNEFSSASRLAFSRDSLGIVRDYPWTGTGLGTFATAFRHYQTQLVGFMVDHPHNDYVEFATETGLLGAALLFLPIFWLLIRMTVSFLRDTRRYRSSILLGCIGSVLAILIHSALDFNLQIPANALVLAVVLGLGYKATCVEPHEEQPARASSRAPARAVSRRR